MTDASPNQPRRVSSAPARLFAGTSGWAYPTWKPGFYPPKLPAKKFLNFYASQLTSVEVNYTFRSLPSRTMLEGWLAETPQAFRFSFKAPQRITHFARLRDCEPHIEALLTALAPAREAARLGLILFQLPPNFKADHARLAAFLAIPALRTQSIAFEFRHESWFSPAITALLEDRQAALCIADTDDLQSPELHTAATHTSFRLRRDGGYTRGELAAFAQRFTKLAQTRDVYVYFRHQDEPTGALNARDFLHLAGVAPQPEPVA